MGITGLLPFVKNSCRSANIRDFEGATVAIDAYSWLHKGAFSCAEKLVKGEKTDGYVFYCIKLLNMLLDAGVKPIMVFDGCNLSSKEVTEKKRRENREKTKQRGKALLCEGKIKEARECFQRCVDVTPEMAREVIEACRKKSIDCIVAPYEADAQLAYLDKIGMAQIIITEDSDLILFGCSKILFKMDSYGGGLLYEKENLAKSFGGNALKFSFEKFRYTCILSGCDYLASLPGIGLAKACKFFMLTSNTDLSSILYKLPSYLRMPKLAVSDQYVDLFIKANNTFLYQLVFCPQKKAMVPLNSYPENINVSELEYAGKYLPADLAYQLAVGNINVKTLKEFDSVASKNCPSVNEDKSFVWGTKLHNEKAKLTNITESTAFKFSVHKVKATLPSKRKHEEGVDTTESENDMETLLSMYGEQSHNRSHQIDDEDPLVFSPKKKIKSSTSVDTSTVISPSICKNVSNLPLQRIVRSRFFRTESKLVEELKAGCETPNNSTGSHLSSNKGDKRDVNDDSAKESDDDFIDEAKDIHAANECVVSFDLALLSPKKSDKENIVHRFAKKKIADFKFNKVVDDLEHSIANDLATKSKGSWLDIIDDERNVSTSTISSAIKAERVLSSNAKSISGMPINSSVNSHLKKGKVKISKLITTKLFDYKWSKDCSSRTKLNSSSGSDGNSSYESVPENEILTESANPKTFLSLQSENIVPIPVICKANDDNLQHVDDTRDVAANSVNNSHNFIEDTQLDLPSPSVLNESQKSNKTSFSDMDSGIELVGENEDIELMDINSSVSPYFQADCKNMQTFVDSQASEDSVQLISDEDLDVSGNSRKSVPQNFKGKIESTSAKTSLLALKSSSLKYLSKPGKCRPLGLSKNKKAVDRKVSRKETLLNFNFIRKPKNEVEVLS